MTEEQFRSDPAHRQVLSELLSNPTLQIALRIIRDRELTVRPVASVACDLVQVFALMGAKRVGYLEALDNLEELAKVASPKTPEVKPFEQP